MVTQGNTDVNTSRIIARPDKVEAYIDLTKDNAQYLSSAEFFHEMVPAVSQALGMWVNPKNPDFSPPQSHNGKPDLGFDGIGYDFDGFADSFDGVSGQFCSLDDSRWRFRLENHTCRVDFEGITDHFPATCSTRQKPAYQPPPALAKHLFPKWSDLFHLGYQGNFLGKIRITNRLKLDHFWYLEYLVDLLSTIESRITLVPAVLEIAYDSPDPAAGRDFRMNLCPPRFDPRWVYHFVKYRHRGREFALKIEGPNPGGLDEYAGHRPKLWGDTRPSDVRPQGGNVVLHSYEKQIHLGRGSMTLCRTEAQLHRKRLKYLMKKYGIETASALLRCYPAFAAGQAGFGRINTKKLCKAHREAREWPFDLEAFTTRGQAYILHRHGINFRDFLDPLPFPQITCLADPYAEPHSIIDRKSYRFDPIDPGWYALGLYPQVA